MSTPGWAFYALRVDDLVPKYQETFPLGNPAAALAELATSLAGSSALLDSGHVVAVRNSPAALVIISNRSAGLTSRLGHLDEQIQSILDRTRYVDWSAVGDAVEATADRLIDVLGRDFLERAGFEAIPRGGHIVLGLLSYHLGLSADQTSPGSDSQRPLILVDDCALTGTRFKQAISPIPKREVVYATLFSPPALRDAIEEAEQSVVACISGVDLTDYTEKMPPTEREAWTRRWRERGEVYWTGQPEHLVFPWGETDVGIWNPTTEQLEPGWRVGPPSLCVSNRPPGWPEQTDQVQVANLGTGSLRLPPSVLYASLGTDMAVFDLSSSTAWNLKGTAAAMWTSILETPSLTDAARIVAEQSEVDFETVLEDIGNFAEELMAKGLLVKTSTQSNRPT